MWDFFKKRRLVGKGLDCGKRRRSVEQNEFAETLQSGWLARALLLAAFIAGLAILIFTGQQDEPAKKFLLCLLIFVTAIVQLWINHPQTLAVNSRLCLLLSVFLVQLTAIKVTLFQAASGHIDLQLVPLLVP